jgi:hypothetical protein
MTPLAIAATRSTSDPDAFLRAFNAASNAGRWDLDLEALITRSLIRGEYAKVAGLLEGIAAAHAQAGMPTKAAPIGHRYRNLRGRFTGGEAA